MPRSELSPRAARLDTRSGPGVVITPTQQGEHLFTFQSTAYGDACIGSTQSNEVAKSINVLSCGPKFQRDIFGNLPHVNATTINVYVPSDMYDLWNPTLNSGPLKGAIDDWNAAITSTGVVLNLTESPCSGASCIAMIEVALAGRCAELAMPTNSLSGGAPSNTTYLRWTSGDVANEIPSWRISDATALRHTAAHELGHALGLNHPLHGDAGCDDISDGVMLDLVTTCGGATSAYNPTIEDTLPIRKTVYGGAPQKKCGFPVP